MKRRILALLLAVLTLTALTAAAFAADTLGAFNLKADPGYTLTVDGGTGTGGFYANAKKFKLTCTGLSGQYSLVLLLKEGADQSDATKGIPTESNLQYIDQQNIKPTTEFILFPKQMEPGTYNVYVSTNNADLKKVASLEYGEQPKYTLGDINDDGAIDVNDALLTLKIAAGVITPTPEQMVRADIDANGVVDVNDALKVLKRAAGVITSF